MPPASRSPGARERICRGASAFVFFALVLFFFREPMMTDTINTPVDYYESLPPWVNVIKHPHPSNPFVNDVALQLVPWAHAVREQWRAFEPPLWEPTAASGYPLLANGQSQALSILRLLALPLSLGHALTAEGAWKVLLAFTFTFLFCRRRGYSARPRRWEERHAASYQWDVRRVPAPAGASRRSGLVCAVVLPRRGRSFCHDDAYARIHRLAGDA
jgi:hypothetical protein